MPRNAPEGVFSTRAANKPRLLDHVRERLRTERACADWIKRFTLYPNPLLVYTPIEGKGVMSRTHTPTATTVKVKPP